MRAVLVAVVLAASLTTCSGSPRHGAAETPDATTTEGSNPPTQQELADHACKAAAGASFENAQPTTVGAIHAITGGPSPSGHPWKWILASEPDDTFAAWCWRREGPRYVAFVVGYGVGPRFVVVSVNMSTDQKPRPGPLPVT